MRIRYEGPADEVEFVEQRDGGRYEVRTAKRGVPLEVPQKTAQSLLEQGSSLDEHGERSWGGERPWVEDAPIPVAPVKARSTTKGGEEV